MATDNISKALFKGFPLPAYAWQRGERDFVLIDYNEAAERITGGRITGLVGQELRAVYGEDNPVVEDIERCFSEKSVFEKEMEYRFVTQEKTRLLKTTYSHIHPDLVMVYTEDITELRTTAEEMRKREGLLSAIVDGISEAVVAVDREGRVSFVNRATTELFDYTGEELLGAPLETLVPIPIRARHVELRRGYMTQPRTRRMGIGLNLMARKKDGREFPVEIGLDYVETEGDTTVVAIISDITERRKTEVEIETAARTDPLTGLLNRRAFQSVLDREHRRAGRSGHEYSLIMCDIDHFKSINDTYGHDFGDTVLAQVADLLRSRLRMSDSLCRWGGEEFLILLPDTPLTDACPVAEELRSGVAALAPRHDGSAVEVRMSFGVIDSTYAQDRTALVSLADQNLYRAKSGGRNRVVGGD